MKSLLLMLAIGTQMSMPTASSQESKGPDASLRVIPAPRVVEMSLRSFKVASSTRIVLGNSTTREDAFAAEQINRELAELKGHELRVVEELAVRKVSGNVIFIGTPKDPLALKLLGGERPAIKPEMKQEGYFLRSDRDAVVILGESAAGRFYGVMTLLQMIARERKSLVVSGAAVTDWPLEQVRGISDDISRGQVSTTDNFKKIIRFLARYKLNTYSPYLEDLFQFKNHPKIGKGRGALSAAEVKELDAYAKQYHVDLVPTFETLGHWENILQIPEYASYAEFPGAHTLNVSDERVYALLDEMIGELCAAFSSPYFNMGADESWDVGLGASKQRVAASDIATVHAEHYKRVFDIVRKYHKKPVMYGDVILNNPTILDKIPKDVVIVDWQYWVGWHYPSAVTFKDAGFPFIVSPAVENFTGPFPNYVNTFANVRQFNEDGYLNGAQGILTSNWNDYGGEALRELNYYGYAWTAECAWHPADADQVQFSKNFFLDFFGSPLAVEPARSVYAILSDPLNQMEWHELWRHPMLPLRQNPVNPLWRIQSIESTMPLAQDLLEKISSVATRNRDHVEYLRFITHLNEWFEEKLKAGIAIRSLTENAPPAANADSLSSAVIALSDSVVPDLMKLKEEFRRMWLTTNVDANLGLLLARYDRQAEYWNEKRDQVKNRQLWVDPLIESSWIYHPNAHPRWKDSSAVQVRTAYFRKTVEVPEAGDSGWLQLIGDTRVKVYFNGKELGEVTARRSLSLTVESQRVKMWNITPFLVKGMNVIAAEAENYDQFGSAGLNIDGIIRSGDTTVPVLSDQSWRVTDRPAGDWSGVDYNDSTWVHAAVFPYPAQVIRPEFDKGQASWIER